MIDYIEVNINSIDSEIKYISGYSSKVSWKSKKLTVYESENGNIYLIDDEEITPSVAIRMLQHILVYEDVVNGWICVGDEELNSENKTIKIQENILFFR